jgi:hypothetical protein
MQLHGTVVRLPPMRFSQNCCSLLEAGLVLAKAEFGEARAARDCVYAGPGQEQIDTLARDIAMANAGWSQRRGINGRNPAAEYAFTRPNYGRPA